MNTIKFANLDEYSLVPSGFSVDNERASFVIIADEIGIGDVEATVETASALDRVEVIDDDKKEVVAVAEGLTVVSKLQKEFDYSYEVPTGEVDPETGEPVYETITCDIIRLWIQLPGLKEAVDKNSADIEYIAIMSDIEL